MNDPSKQLRDFISTYCSRRLDDAVGARMRGQAEIKHRHAKNHNGLQAGAYVNDSARAWTEHIEESFLQLVQGLAKEYQALGTNQPDQFWQIAEETLKPRMTADYRSGAATLNSGIAQTGGLSGGTAAQIQRHFEQASMHGIGKLQRAIRENLQRDLITQKPTPPKESVRDDGIFVFTIKNTCGALLNFSLPVDREGLRFSLTDGESRRIRLTPSELASSIERIEANVQKKTFTIALVSTPDPDEEKFLRKLHSPMIEAMLPKKASQKPEKAFETGFTSYTKIRPLGGGGCGDVFEVESDSGERYALKLMRKNAINSDRLKRFKQEISFCLSPVHPNIVRVVETGFAEVDGVKCPFYVMPLYSGSLREKLKKGIPLSDRVKLIRAMIEASSAAHLRGVYHRDIKPENFLYDENLNTLVMSDFGIAHFAEELLVTEIETKRADKMANNGYSAPEQRRRDGVVDHRADIYALGLITNEMFTGHVPQGHGYKRIGDAVHEYGFLDPLVDKMIHQLPENRFQSLDELLLALDKAIEIQ